MVADQVHSVQVPNLPVTAPAVTIKQQTLPSLSELFLGKENVVKQEGRNWSRK